MHVQGLGGGNRFSNGHGGCVGGLYFDNRLVCSIVRKLKCMSIDSMEQEGMYLFGYHHREN